MGLFKAYKNMSLFKVYKNMRLFKVYNNMILFNMEHYVMEQYAQKSNSPNLDISNHIWIVNTFFR